MKQLPACEAPGLWRIPTEPKQVESFDATANAMVQCTKVGWLARVIRTDEPWGGYPHIVKLEDGLWLVATPDIKVNDLGGEVAAHA